MRRVERVGRRRFLGDLFSAGAFVLGARLLPSESLAGTPGGSVAQAGRSRWQPSVYLGIEPDNSVVVVAHRSEMGTGIRTVLPVVVADELDADWSKVRIEQAIGDTKYGSQNTDGSCSIRDFYDAMREAGATARLMLVRAAAAQWGVPAGECRAHNHAVHHAATKRSLSYGQLATLAAAQPVPKKSELGYKTPAEYRYIGKDIAPVDQHDIVTGKAVYGYDATMPGMVHASIERSPVLGGKLTGYDDRETRAVKGVVKTVVLDPFKPPHQFQALGGVAVIAENTWAALEGRRRLRASWDPGPNGAFNSDTFRQKLLETVRQPQTAVRNVGNVDSQFAKNQPVHEAEYYVPLLAHATMEPPAAVADYRDGKVVIHAATQNPQAVQETVAAALGIDQKNVECHVTLLGGGFGRKSKPDYVAEAALLSKSVGRPVKIAWTREEDIKFDFYHSVAAMYLKASLSERGLPEAWLQRSAFPTIGSTFAPGATMAQEFEMGMGWIDVPFDIPNLRVENGPATNHVRIGWLRAVANIYHAFAVQSFIDELATRARRDAVEYQLEVIGRPRRIDFGAEGTKFWNNGKSLDEYPFDTARLRRVIDLVAEKSGWAKKKPTKGHALGFAAHRSFLAYIAVVAEVMVDDQGRLSIPRIDIAVDAGRLINPDRVRSQFEGAAVFGTSIAMLGEITAKNGVIQQSNFDGYQVARIHEAPRQTFIHIVESDAPPVGVGEPGVPPVSPAICNAIAAATGKRIRQLPVGRKV